MRDEEDKDSLLNHFGNFHTNIYGNRNFVEHLRNHGKFLDHDENRELDLILIDYDDPKRNVFEVTEEWAFHNGHYSTREDVVFLINGIPVLVIECKNATKDEAIALGVDQIRRYHIETPELFVPEQIFTATDAIGFSYGVTWNTVRRNIFNWKDTEVGKLDQLPKILIVTEKLLTGFDAPLLYAMYLDKPMRDHTLLQTIARVNRPYENEAQEMVKPHGFVLDFVGIFDKLEKALAFDSDEVNAIVKDIKLLKLLFKNKMEQEAPKYLDLIEREFNDKDVDTLIEHFRDPERRKRFFKEYKEIEMLYEIISPDAFLRPFMESYGTLAAIFQIVQKAYAKRVQIDREFLRKTERLIREQIGSYPVRPEVGFIEINAETIELIKKRKGGESIKVINLIKGIEKLAEEESDDLYLIAMAERARAVHERFENRQSNTAEALEELLNEVGKNETRKKEQAEKSFDGLTYFVYRSLLDARIENAEEVSKKIRQAFSDYPDWRLSEVAQRELRLKVTFTMVAETEDPDQVAVMVDELFTLLDKADRI